jgi:Amt family ammonium transporter
VAKEAALQVDRLWVLVAGAMVFLMQLGFLLLEVGSVRPKAVTVTALKNVVDWSIGAVAFFFIGWGLMFGHTGAGGVIGTDGWMLGGDMSGGSSIGLFVHFLFQLAFAGTAATIVSGAMAERTSFQAYMAISFLATALIYPVVGHWAWGNSFFADNQSLLVKLGFIDFAGSTVVHSVGGWISLAGCLLVGPRLGRFTNAGKTVKTWDVAGLHWVGAGVLLLWFCWWGFNGGSTLALNDQVGLIIQNTNLAATAGGFGAMLWCWLFQNKYEISSKFLNGILAGLVAITANCHMVTPAAALLIGLSGGMLSVIAAELLLKWQIDDVVGAMPVHLVNGIWGTLCVGLFGKASMFPMGHTRLEQIGVQLIGVVVCGAFSFIAAYVGGYLIKQWIGIRVSPQEETMGFDIAGVREGPKIDIDPEELRKLMGGAGGSEGRA